MENVAFKQHVYLDLDSFIFFKFNIPYISPSAWAVGFDRDRERDLDSFIFFKFNIPYISPSAWAVGFDRDRERESERETEWSGHTERTEMNGTKIINK